MAELEIEGPFEEQWGAVKSAVREHHVILKGNGHEGIVDFVVGMKAQFRLIVFLITLFGILSGAGTVVVAVLEYNRQVQQHLLHFPKLFDSNGALRVYAYFERTPKEAGNSVAFTSQVR